MLTFIVLLLFGLAIAFFAGQNTAPVTVSLANYQLREIPLYVLIVSALLIGFFISWIISLINRVFTAFALRGRDSTIKTSQREVGQLRDRVHELEVENARLRGKDSAEPVVINKHEDDHHESHDYRPSFFERLKHSFR